MSARSDMSLRRPNVPDAQVAAAPAPVSAPVSAPASAGLPSLAGLGAVTPTPAPAPTAGTSPEDDATGARRRFVADIDIMVYGAGVRVDGMALSKLRQLGAEGRLVEGTDYVVILKVYEFHSSEREYAAATLARGLETAMLAGAAKAQGKPGVALGESDVYTKVGGGPVHVRHSCNPRYSSTTYVYCTQSVKTPATDDVPAAIVSTQAINLKAWLDGRGYDPARPETRRGAETAMIVASVDRVSELGYLKVEYGLNKRAEWYDWTPLNDGKKGGMVEFRMINERTGVPPAPRV